jgi:hypothetical protein
MAENGIRPEKRLAAAFTDSDRQTRKRRDLAKTFKADERLERALALKKTDPAAYEKLSATTRMSLGLYLQAKEAHEQEQSA